MLLIVIGSGSFFALEAYENIKDINKKSRNKVTMTTLTDFELKPIE